MSVTEQSKPSGTDELLRRYRETGDRRARERLIERHLPLVRTVARRFAHRGERVEDLVQVGSIGLIEAVDRFDPDKGSDLARFAVPTIAGEIKNHLRDKTSVVRIPRRVASEVGGSRAMLPLGPDDDGPLAADVYQTCDDRLLLAAGFRTLDPRQRRILHLRFYAGLSQSEIAGEVGLSQIQVSRVIRASLERMRGALARSAAPEPAERA